MKRMNIIYQRVDFVWKDLVEGVAVVPERDPAVGGDVCDVDVLVDVDDELALGMDLDQDLLLVHHLHHLAHVRTGLSLKKRKHLFKEMNNRFTNTCDIIVLKVGSITTLLFPLKTT